MKRIVFCFAVILFAGNLFAQIAPEQVLRPVVYDGLQIQILDEKGNPLEQIPMMLVKELEPGFEQTPLCKFGAAAVHFFKYKDSTTPVILLSCVDPVSKMVALQIKTFEELNGKISIGFNVDSVGKKMLPVSIDGNRAEVRSAKGPVYLGWNDQTANVVSTPRKPLAVILAEYGAEDRWKDVTKDVQSLVRDNSLDFTAGNDLFGDPAGGIVKSFVLTYSVDEDEKIETFNEGQRIRIQCNAAQYQLVPQAANDFEFAILKGKTLPEKIPTYKEIVEAAEKEAKEGPASKLLFFR